MPRSADRPAATTLRTGVWRRAPMDWAYRIEVKDYGSIAGVGFESRDAARKAMHEEGCDFPLQQAALMLRNTPGVAARTIEDHRDDA